ncbi:MAG: hypothetical protein ACE5OZ_10610 [Candidatus Heimdallarchaeota archaeon]
MAQERQTKAFDPTRNMKMMASIFIPVCIFFMIVAWVMFFLEVVTFPNSSLDFVPLLAIPIGIVIMCVILALIWLEVITFPMAR